MNTTPESNNAQNIAGYDPFDEFLCDLWGVLLLFVGQVFSAAHVPAALHAHPSASANVMIVSVRHRQVYNLTPMIVKT